MRRVSDRSPARNPTSADFNSLGASIFVGSKSGAAKQVCDYFARPLVTTRCELLQPLGVLVLDTDDDRQFCVGISDIRLDVSRIDRRQVGVEIARTGIRICPRIVHHAQLPRSLRSRGEESHPVTISQVVGSIGLLDDQRQDSAAIGATD